MLLPFGKIHLKDYDLTVQKNFFQVGNQYFQYNYHYQGQQSLIPYADPLSCMRNVFDVSFCMKIYKKIHKTDKSKRYIKIHKKRYTFIINIFYRVTLQNMFLQRFCHPMFRY